MARATWKGTIIADSGDTAIVAGNYFFPPDSVERTYLSPSDTRTTRAYFGEAHYYNVVVDGETNLDAAWYYPEPLETAASIKDYVAFRNGVEVTD